MFLYLCQYNYVDILVQSGLNDDMPKKRKSVMGRPVTVRADTMLSYRVDADTISALEELSKRWNCSKSEVVRRAVKTARNNAG